jgi:aldehyde:ferredoxin oxidoreductase
MTGGYGGKVLFVDLNTGQCDDATVPEELNRAFIGGQGLGIRLLYERMKVGVDPLGPESMLGFVTGLLTATPVPGSGRYMVVGKSPLTGTWAEANSGGTFGPMMKGAGYDAIFFSGVSARPVFLLVKDGKPSLRDASHLWGEDTYDTEDLLHEELGDTSVTIACIGPSGEARSLLAGIVNEKGRIAARSGLGAVMGSKNLKAVAVKGGYQRIEVGDRNRLKAACQQYLAVIRASEFQKNLSAGGTAGGTSFLVSIGDSPIKNWRQTGLDAMPTVKNLDSANVAKYKKRDYACQACPVRCGALLEQKEGPYAIEAHIHRPEYETTAAFGGMLMNDNLESVIKANDICNRFGIDTMNTGGTLAFAMECYERGLIDNADTGGIELTWGNAEAIVALTEMIVRREGFGAVLADGVGKAAERIGQGSEEFAMAVLGQSLAYHDPRMSPALATAMICDANPAHHMDCGITAQLEMGVSVGTDPALQAPTLNPFGDFDKRGPLHALGAKFHQLFNAAGLCALYTIGSTVPVAELIGGVTGWDFGWPEALEAGYRILTLRQAFNVREGFTPDMFQFPRRIREELLSVGPWAGQKIDFETLRKGYFEALDWDLQSGRPHPDVIKTLGLEEIVAAC